MSPAKMEGWQNARVPLSTYRLQLGPDLQFKDALGLLDYLQGLGISDVYASPVFQTPPGSAHGYNVCGFDQASLSLGDNRGFEQLAESLRARRMGLLLDIVPNHMAAHTANCWWLDVLRYGRESRFANFFDIDWERHEGKVLLPMLGEEIQAALSEGKLKLGYSGGGLSIRYYEHELPLSAAGYRFFLLRAMESGGCGSLDDLAAKLAHSPLALEGVIRTLKELLLQEECRTVLERAQQSIESSPALLARLLDLQHYKLAFWRAAPDEINYRRFFDISDLAALRMERVEVFEHTHRQILNWVHQGFITGLRVDHPDGLRLPRAYFAELRRNGGVYVVAEKILCDEEELPGDWKVHGTTGYDFLVALNGLFVDPSAEPAFTSLYRSFTGVKEDFHEIELASKKQVLEMSFRGEITQLAERLQTIAARQGENHSAAELRAALVELICSFPVYRTYAEPEVGRLSHRDQEVVIGAAVNAKGRAEGRREEINFAAQTLLRTDALEDAQVCEFIWRFQQLSGPLTAKGVEDTAFYRYFRFVSLNEVGGNPARFGATPGELHARLLRQSRAWPHSMLASSTHDTKRGEDTRARLNALSEFPEEWREFVERAAALNARFKKQELPDRNDEYLFYQTVLGASGFSDDWGSLKSRVSAYMLKAAREGKRNTSWIDQNPGYEAALQKFIERTLDPEANAEFVELLKALRDRISFFGVVNSLAQTLVKIAGPGVPDFYQGAELWDFSLVDPDNRQPVDFQMHQEALARLNQRLAREKRESLLQTLLSNYSDPLVKLFVIHQGLQARTSRRELFQLGEYIPLHVDGSGKEHVFAFARKRGKEHAIIAAPRLSAALCRQDPCWPPDNPRFADTVLRLPEGLTGKFREQFSGAELALEGEARLSALWTSFPGALLLSS